MKEDKGITLIALVITIIILLILAGITITFMLGDNGILNEATQAGKDYSEQAARERLEIALANLATDKVINPDYNETTFIDNNLIKENMQVEGNFVTVDGWKFEIDRTVPKIGESIEKEEIIPEDKYDKRDMLVYLDGYTSPNNNIWKDKSGKNNDAVMSGVYSHDSTKKCYSFTDKLGLGRISKFAYTKGITISFYAELLDDVTNKYIYIGNGYPGPSNCRPGMFFNKSVLQITVGSDTESTVAHNGEINKKYTVTMTISEDKIAKIYINDKFIYQYAHNVTIGMPSNDFRIHSYASTSNTDSASSSLINCNIYNVLVYDRALTNEEVSDIHNNNLDRYK